MNDDHEVRLIALITIVVTLAILVFVVIGNNRLHKSFAKTCDDAGGITVFDSRQYQCIIKR